MAKEKKLNDVIWIILIWILALALALVCLVKFKILFHS